MNKKKEGKGKVHDKILHIYDEELSPCGLACVSYKWFNKGQVFLDQPEQVRSNTNVNFPHTGMVE